MSADPNAPWDLVSQVRRSDRKTWIIKRLADDPASASELADEMGIQTNSASNYLHALKRMDPPLVVCLTPDQPHHRLYSLTEAGEELLEYI